MAIRYAGDIFSGSNYESKRPFSYLTSYFPDLKKLREKKSDPSTGEAKSTRGFQAVSPFVGFKPFGYG